MQAKLLPAGDRDYERCAAMGLVPHEVLSMNRLAGSDECIFTATGITDGFLLRGVQSREGALVTHTLLLSGTERKARFLESTHFLH